MNARRTRKPFKKNTQKPAGPALKSVSTRGASKPSSHMKPAAEQQKLRKDSRISFSLYTNGLPMRIEGTVEELMAQWYPVLQRAPDEHSREARNG